MAAHTPKENTIACLTVWAVIISKVEPTKAAIRSTVCSMVSSDAGRAEHDRLARELDCGRLRARRDRGVGESVISA